MEGSELPSPTLSLNLLSPRFPRLSLHQVSRTPGCRQSGVNFCRRHGPCWARALPSCCPFNIARHKSMASRQPLLRLSPHPPFHAPLLVSCLSRLRRTLVANLYPSPLSFLPSIRPPRSSFAPHTPLPSCTNSRPSFLRPTTLVGTIKNCKEHRTSTNTYRCILLPHLHTYNNSLAVTYALAQNLPSGLQYYEGYSTLSPSCAHIYICFSMHWYCTQLILHFN